MSAKGNKNQYSTKSGANGLTQHDSIYIDGNSNFTSANGVVDGSGTKNDPFIIENWKISISSKDGIHINNTSAYFIIRHCYIHGIGHYLEGIHFSYVTNGKIENVTSYHNQIGIYFVSSSNNQIINSTICNNYCGISFILSSNNQIHKCNVSNNSWRGIRLYHHSSNNTISMCNVHDNSYGISIRFQYSSNNTLYRCDIHNNFDVGIYLLSSYNIISESNIYNNTGIGITISQYPNNKISGCSIYNNSDVGINFLASSNNILKNNTLINNTCNIDIFGYRTSEYHQDIDTSNTVNNKHVYYLVEKKDLMFNGNTAEIGYISIISCKNISLNNIIISNNGQGILMVNTSYSTIANCMLYNNFKGVAFKYSSNNTLTNCIIYNNSFGIYIDWNSDANIIYYNDFINNTQNAYDNCINYWCNASVGNYWDDHNGSDKNGDGIIDIPYNIPGGDNKDRYPLMNPVGTNVTSPLSEMDVGKAYINLILYVIITIIGILVTGIWLLRVREAKVKKKIEKNQKTEVCCYACKKVFDVDIKTKPFKLKCPYCGKEGEIR